MISSRAWCSASAMWVSRWMRPLGRNARSAQETGPSPGSGRRPLRHFLPWKMPQPSGTGSGSTRCPWHPSCVPQDRPCGPNARGVQGPTGWQHALPAPSTLGPAQADRQGAFRSTGWCRGLSVGSRDPCHCATPPGQRAPGAGSWHVCLGAPGGGGVPFPLHLTVCLPPALEDRSLWGLCFHVGRGRLQLYNRRGTPGLAKVAGLIPVRAHKGSN